MMRLKSNFGKTPFKRTGNPFSVDSLKQPVAGMRKLKNYYKAPKVGRRKSR